MYLTVAIMSRSNSSSSLSVILMSLIFYANFWSVIVGNKQDIVRVKICVVSNIICHSKSFLFGTSSILPNKLIHRISIIHFSEFSRLVNVKLVWNIQCRITRVWITPVWLMQIYNSVLTFLRLRILEAMFTIVCFEVSVEIILGNQNGLFACNHLFSNRRGYNYTAEFRQSPDIFEIILYEQRSYNYVQMFISDKLAAVNF